VTASLVTSSTLRLSWLLPLSNGGTAITDYVVEVSSNGGLSWTAIPHTPSNSLSFNVTGLRRATAYRFRVSAVTGSAVGAQSTEVLVTTLPLLPTTPVSLRISNVTSSSAVLAWALPADNGGAALTNYRIEYSRDGVTWSVAPRSPSTKLGATLSGLAPGTTYRVRVAAVNSVGFSAFVAGTLTTLVSSASAPRSVTASLVTSSTLRLSWPLPLSNGGTAISDYVVEVSSNGGLSWTAIPHTPSNSLSFNVTGLRRATAYRFRISAVTSVGVGARSTEVLVTTLS
jgi:titin